MIRDIYKKLDEYPKRFFRKQKDQFLAFISSELFSYGYNTEVVEGQYIVKSKNLETNCENPQIIIGAHYDTPTILPFYFEYLFRLFGHTRQFLLIGAMFLFVTLYNPMTQELDAFYWIFKPIELIFILSFLFLLFPNPSNRNDNTSGIATLLYLAKKLSNNSNMKDKVKFMFFDNEELGLLGSLMQRKK